MLIGVGVRQGGGPLTRLSGAIAQATAASGEAACLRSPGAFYVRGDASVVGQTNRAGMPSGERHGSAWFQPRVAGGLASRARAQGSGVLNSANLAAGYNLASDMTGTGTISDAAMGLIASAVATLTGAGALTADVIGVVQAAGDLAGAGDLSGALGALASLSAALDGTGALAAAITALANISADIVPYTELSPESLAQAILDAADAIETGLTPRQALRLITAAAAGKSTASGTEYRAAVADHKVRIDATVDGSGNRTAIVYDTDD